MRVLLINPRHPLKERYGKDLARFAPVCEPMGLAYLAGMLEAHGHEVDIWDGMVDQVFDIRKWPKYELFGVTILTPMYESAKRLIKRIRTYDYAYHAKTPIVVGGAHPTACLGDTLADIPEIDFAIQGDGEYQLIDYIEGVEHVRTDNLDDLPLPARHLLPMDKYRITRSRTQGNHAYTVIVGRGCPFKCGFCSRIHGQKVRFHSVERVLQEVEILVRDYGAKEINFEADTITLDYKFILGLCDGLRRSGLAVKWTCESRVDTVNSEMLELMKQAGCWQISYGVETGSQRLLNLIQKGITLDCIRRTFKDTRKAGINTRAFFMLGLPTETRKESERTIQFAKELNAEWSQFSLYTPFPGTALWDQAEKESPISKNWSDFQTHAGWTEKRPAWTPRGRGAGEMKELQKRAYRAVYLRPRVIGRFLRDIRTRAGILSLIQGFWTILKTYGRTNQNQPTGS